MGVDIIMTVELLKWDLKMEIIKRTDFSRNTNSCKYISEDQTGLSCDTVYNDLNTYLELKYKIYNQDFIEQS